MASDQSLNPLLMVRWRDNFFSTNENLIMKTRQEQKEIEKQLNLISRLYGKIDDLKAENKELKQQVKKLNKPAVRFANAEIN